MDIWGLQLLCECVGSLLFSWEMHSLWKGGSYNPAQLSPEPAVCGPGSCVLWAQGLCRAALEQVQTGAARSWLLGKEIQERRMAGGRERLRFWVSPQPVLACCLGLLSSRAGTKQRHWPGQGSWQPALLLAWAPIVNVTPGSGKQGCAGSVL